MESVLIFKQILSTNWLRKCMEICPKNLYFNIAAGRIKGYAQEYE